MEFHPTHRNLKNGSVIPVEHMPDDSNSQFSDRNRRKKPLVERTLRTSDIGTQPDSLGSILNIASLSEAQLQACDSEFFTMFLSRINYNADFDRREMNTS